MNLGRTKGRPVRPTQGFKIDLLILARKLVACRI
jgi:hypothetical protein